MKPTNQKPNWIGPIFYFAITGAHAWYLHGLVHIAGLLFLSFIGGMLLYFGLKWILGTVLDASFSIWTILSGLILIALGTLTLIPGWPNDVLVKTPGGWSVLEHRTRLLDKALYDGKDLLVKKIAWAGLGEDEPRDSFGNPLIDDAKDPEIVTLLLDAGLNPDARDEGGTTLLMRTHDEQVAEALLAGGANPNAQDDNGRTPLMYVTDANIDFLKLLLDHGADVHAVDDFNRSVGDWVGSSSEIDRLFREHAPGGIRRNSELDFLSHAKRDWLDQENLPVGSSLKPSLIRVTPAPMIYGALAELEIRLSNDTDTDRVLKVEANLNTEALFVASSHDGTITNPYQAQINQAIDWPLLALPARSSGVLNMSIILRDEWDAGDVSIDVRAENILTYAEEESLFLNHHQPLSETADTEGSLQATVLGFLLITLPFIIWLAGWRFLGKEHAVTRLTGRLVAGIFSLLCLLGAYSMTMDLLRPYFQYQETEARILDRRFYLETSTTSSSSQSRSRSTTYKIPIIAARYNASGKEVVAIGPASKEFFRDTKLGDAVPAWYDPDNPEEFTVVRGVSFFSVFAICLLSISCLVLMWVAVRQKSD